jgi:putative endonuclease
MRHAADPRRRLGERGEELAARHLEARGYEVVERNFRTRYGELDIVVRDARFLVFCEVKTRIVRLSTLDVLGPFAAMGIRKQRQVRAMAREWLGQGRLEGSRPAELRFDAIGISFDATGRLLSLEHLEAAF